MQGLNPDGKLQMVRVDASGYLLVAGSGGGGGSSVTNLTTTVSPTGVVVVSDTGTDATIPLADATNAGVMPPAAVTQLAGLPAALAGKMANTLPAMQVALDSGTALEKATFQSSVSGDSSSVSASRSLTALDINDSLFCTSTPTVTVPAGLGQNFGVALFGAVAVAAGSGVTVTDQRVAGAANPSAALVPAPTADTYILVGSKP